MEIREYDIGIKEKYFDITVQCFEKMYPFIEPDKNEKGEIKFNIQNKYKKMRDLINTEQKGYMVNYLFKKRKTKGREQYLCPKCSEYVTIKGIKHKKSCEILEKMKKCERIFHIYEYEEYVAKKKGKISNIINLEEEDESEDKKGNFIKLMNKENNLIDLEKEEEQKKEENVIISLKDGIYYVTKKTKKNEYEIMKELQTLEHFPKILNKKEIENNFFVEMPYYQFIKVNFTENMWFVKNYVKYLLLTIQELNSKNYFHGDIKPDNYLYLNPQKYVLIDFNASGKINGKDLSQKIATYPYIPPEINKYCEINIKNDKKRDLWSVGIILLLFMVKNEDIFENILKEKLKEKLENLNQEEKSLFQYAMLYGVNKSNIKIAQKIKVEGKLGNFNNYFIENNYKRDENEKKNAIDLIKKLLKLDTNKRINIKNAINHAFFKNMNEANEDIIKYYKEIITQKKLEEKYNMIKDFKICVICNKHKIDEILKECRYCGNYYHTQCIKNKSCTCKSEIPDFEFMKIINTYLCINKYINKKFIKNEQIDLQLPPFDKKNAVYYLNLIKKNTVY